MTEKNQRWNNTYSAVLDYPGPNSSLDQYRALLPKQGLALDLACGLGADALYLAGQGYEVVAWDASKVAIERLRREANARAIEINAACLEITPEAFAPERFDLIYVHRYLDRDIIPALIEGLKPGGILFYQTFTQAHNNSDAPSSGPKNSAYRLTSNELLSHCKALTIRLFLDGFSTDPATHRLASKATSLIIAEKPKRL